MRILISGASGLVGRALTRRLESGGHTVGCLVRRAAAAMPDISWDPERGVADADALSRFDAVVHLAGENIATGRWTEAKKARIRDSRIEGTRAIARAMMSAPDGPRILVSASAVGWYGDRDGEILSETSDPGRDFLADVCREWELEAMAASEAGIRVVCLRTGVVLARAGGALAKMLRPFRFGLGGVLWTGRQWMSWVTVTDLARIIEHALETEDLEGPVNATSPGAVTNREFTKALGRVLRRPTVLPMPAPAARLVFGEMADALLLASQRVRPSRLVESGFRFEHPNLDGALDAVLYGR